MNNAVANNSTVTAERFARMYDYNVVRFTGESKSEVAAEANAFMASVRAAGGSARVWRQTKRQYRRVSSTRLEAIGWTVCIRTESEVA